MKILLIALTCLATSSSMFATKPQQTATAITATFAGIVFDDTNFQFGNADRIYNIPESTRVPHQWNQAFYYNATTNPTGPYNAYAQLYVAVVQGEVQQAHYNLFSDLSPLDQYGRPIPLKLFYVDNLLYSGDSHLGALLPNLMPPGGTLVVIQHL